MILKFSAVHAITSRHKKKEFQDQQSPLVGNSLKADKFWKWIVLHFQKNRAVPATFVFRYNIQGISHCVDTEKQLKPLIRSTREIVFYGRLESRNVFGTHRP